MKQLQVAVLGCTGSIGQQTLDVIRMHTEKMHLAAISVHHSIDQLAEICQEFHPEYVGIVDPAQTKFMDQKQLDVKIITGEETNQLLAELPEVDVIVIAITGMVAIFPLLAAAKAGKQIALANKECIVCGGEWMQQQLKNYSAIIHPVDSEQSAIYQCLQGIHEKQEVQRLILTASGGPFRCKPMEQMHHITVEQALKHPNWSMGKKITIDSATLINKGLEVIEAAYLFDMTADQIDVLIHPQSIVHSMIETCDGSILAQLGSSDMRLPIQYALTYPARLPSPASTLTAQQLSCLQFEEPDTKRFPGLQLAYDALRIGGTAPAIYNAANEVAVERFLNHEIAFLEIAACVADTLQAIQVHIVSELEEILYDDRHARDFAYRWQSSSVK